MKSKEKKSELIYDNGKLLLMINGKNINFKTLSYQINQDDKTKCNVTTDVGEFDNVDYINLKTEKFRMSPQDLEQHEERDKEIFINSINAKVKGGNV